MKYDFDSETYTQAVGLLKEVATINAQRSGSGFSPRDYIMGVFDRLRSCSLLLSPYMTAPEKLSFKLECEAMLDEARASIEGTRRSHFIQKSEEFELKLRDVMRRCCEES